VHTVVAVKKSVWIFLLIVFLPAAVLGWLALRSADEQRFILERRTAELFQTQADNVSTAVREAIIVEQRSFGEAVRRLIAENPDTNALALNFPRTLSGTWNRKAVGFAMGPGGKILAPTPTAAVGNKAWGSFLWEYSPFLCNTQPAVVYAVGNDVAGKTGTSQRSKSDVAVNSLSAPAMKKATVARAETKSKDFYGATDGAKAPGAPAGKAMPASSSATDAVDKAPEAAGQGVETKTFNSEIIDRAIQTQQRMVQPAEPESNWSALMPATAEFAELTKDADEGMIARFVHDKLDLIFWLRPPEAPTLIFGCLIEAASLRDEWPALLADYGGGASLTAPEHIVALLDDKARPVATLPAGATALDWKRPLVASEIGEAFPHWEAAIYLAKPGALAESARGLYRTIAFLIAGAIGLIAIGGWLVVSDVRRQLALAQQKTDFVSNVSHELKTPLTSIRMFAELMHARPQPPEKQCQFLRIISVESERLTRLINNVLDFAKLERKQRHFDKKPIELHEVIARVWEGHEVHLREAGFTTSWTAAAAPYAIIGDDDALSQVLVNLLSNAEKYSGERKEVELHTWMDDGFLHISVLDRGTGVPRGDEHKIFEAFYRAHDSLSSGIQGSGLGLTLAQQIATAHEGRIDYEPREGGGSRFTLRLPIQKDTAAFSQPSTLNSQP
jgi:signal transduction histidine kinase